MVYLHGDWAGNVLQKSNVRFERRADDLTAIEMSENTCVKVSLRSLWVVIITQTAVHLYDLPAVPDSFDAQS